MINIGQTLYITLPTDLTYEQNNLNFVIDGKKYNFPLNMIEKVVIFGNVTLSSFLIKKCNENNINIFLISFYGKFYGRTSGKTQGNIFLRKRQYDFYEKIESIDIIKNILVAKAVNSANLLIYYSRNEKDKEKSNFLYEKAKEIKLLMNNYINSNDIETLRGIEGKISQTYFSVFDLMLKTTDEKMLFQKRSKHPPENNCNALLSLFYTLYTADITAALETYGLDSQLGYLHKMHSGRPSLSCDVLEEFRAFVVDKFIIKSINLKQITTNDFEYNSEGIHLSEKGLKKH